GRVVVGGAQLGGLQGRRAEGRLAPEKVDGAVVDDREKPSAGVAPLPAVAGGAPPGRQVGVLDHVLRGLALAEDPVGQRVRKPSISVVQRRESPQVAIGERRHEGVIGRVQFGHCRQMYGGGTNADVTDLWRSVLKGLKKETSRATCLRALPLLRSSAAWPWSRSSISSRTAFDAISGCAP